jgi:hypothetical protein
MFGRSKKTGDVSAPMTWALGCLGLLFCVFGDPLASGPTVAVGIAGLRFR